MGVRSKAVWLCALLLILVSGTEARADSTYPLNNDSTVREGYQRFFILDYEGALSRFEGVLKTHEQDPMAMAYVQMTLIFRELYRQDLLDTTYYARENFLSSNRKVEVPHDVAQRIEDLTNGAVSVCDQRIKANGQDKDAYFARSYVRGMHAAWMTLAMHSFSSAAHQGLQSRNDADQVLKLDPQYTDAKMAVGLQQFAVASLPRFLRILVGMVGVGGSKEKGLAMLRESAAGGTVTKVPSMTALSLFLRHDGRYPEALAVAHELAAMYPHNFLFRLEEANLTKDAGRGQDAIRIYRTVLADAEKHGYFVDVRLQLPYFGLAETERGQGDIESALRDYMEAEKQPNCSEWMRRRAQLNSGMMDDLLHHRDAAIEQYRLAAAPGGDQSQADAARKYMKTPYSGR
ncbi:hypothetical protein [Terriglobus saanensis]|uniref:Uncharacterized protein n=1 Tax=Terriglobus saanensis (strain ATCC BAA-1853 / DSM 23119 / SP1PR4) TaxID=401053 RepID=E8V1Q1_TERSS|nr:hypothetical protein [Terriglobus saanensis]ADV82332.1 hypothetical protein AciPR4_1510 [Terriglobus saanensis SP1PR4]